MAGPLIKLMGMPLETSSAAQPELGAQQEIQSRSITATSPSAPSLIPGTRIIPHREVSRSITHQQYQRWRHWIDKNEKEHEKAMASEPPNPILSSTGLPRHVYDTYQAKVPMKVLIDKLEHQKADQPHLTRSTLWEITAKLRLKKQMGLREWEWAVSEPEPEEPDFASIDELVNDQSLESTIETDEPGLESLTLADPVSDDSEDKGKRTTKPEEQPLAYAERIKTFTYTRGDDPMWKGRHYYMTRSNAKHIFAKKGDFSHQKSEEDQNLIPMIDDGVDSSLEPRSFKFVYEDKATQEQQTALTATEYLFNGIGRAEEKELEAEGETQLQALTDAKPQVEAETETADSSGIEGSSPGTVQCRVSSRMSGFSAMSNFSSDGDD